MDSADAGNTIHRHIWGRGDQVHVAPVRSRWLDAMLLLDRIAVATTQAIADAVGEAGASNQGVQVLYALQSNPDLGQSALLELLGCDAGQLSRLITQMAADGVVQRRRDPASSRARRVHLTAKGRAGIRRYEAALVPALARQSEDITALLALLNASPTSQEPIPVADLVALLAYSGQQFTAGMAPNARKHGFRGPENGRILRVIAHDGAAHPGRIAATLGIALPRVSTAATVLEDAGLITRLHPARGDRRRTVLQLTDSGRVAVTDTLKAFRKNIHYFVEPLQLMLLLSSDQTRAFVSHPATGS